MVQIDAFDIFAFVVLAVLVAAIVVVIVVVGSLPGKIARSRSHPQASVIAAAIYSAEPGTAILPTAAAVISETTATGPTASARLVPKIA